MALADLLSQGIPQAQPSLFQQYQDRQRQYLADQQAQAEQAQQMELRNLQMQQAQKQMQWGEEERALAEQERRKRQEQEQAIKNAVIGYQQALSTGDKVKTRAARDNLVAVSAGYANPSVLLQMWGQPEEEKTRSYEPSTKYKEWTEAGGLQGTGKSFAQYLEEVRAPASQLSKPRKYLVTEAKMDFGGWVNENIEKKEQDSTIAALQTGVQSLMERSYREGTPMDINEAKAIVLSTLDNYNVENDVLFGKNTFNREQFMRDIMTAPLSTVSPTTVETPNGEVSLPEDAVAQQIPDSLVSAYKQQYPEYSAYSDGELRQAILKAYGGNVEQAMADAANLEDSKTEDKVESPQEIARQAQSEFDRQKTVWRQWKNTLNPEKTRQAASQWISNHYDTLTQEQRIEADQILGSM